MSENTTEKASLADLERRVAALEHMLLGNSLRVLDETLLIRMYLDAHKLHTQLPAEAGRAIVHSLFLLDTKGLLVLGRSLRDPFPFRPFLVLADHCIASKIDNAEAARDHVIAISQDLLDAAGLELLEPRDAIGRSHLDVALSKL